MQDREYSVSDLWWESWLATRNLNQVRTAEGFEEQNVSAECNASSLPQQS